MGGASIDDEWELTAPNEARTVVLVGRAGNGKSATGNSILGREAFSSMLSCAGVTSTCELQSTILKDGLLLNVIDTPGLFDFSSGYDVIGKEIMNCINLAKDGIHAILVVFSVTTRFTKEEEAALQSLQSFFGDKIADYMIVVFTGGDQLEYNKETLASYLGRVCPEPLQEVLKLCKMRMLLFNNRTDDKNKKAAQLQQLLSLVNMVIAENGGKPYSHEFFAELKKLHHQEEQVLSELKEQIDCSSYEEHLNRISEMVQEKLRETTLMLQNQLKEEQAARLKAEQFHSDEIRLLKAEQAARLKAEQIANDEIRQLRETLERAQREAEEFRKRAESSRCAIL